MEVGKLMICIGLSWEDVGGDDRQQTLFGERSPIRESKVKKVKRVKK